jgi:hypothetical protein
MLPTNAQMKRMTGTMRSGVMTIPRNALIPPNTMNANQSANGEVRYFGLPSYLQFGQVILLAVIFLFQGFLISDGYLLDQQKTHHHEG